MKFLRETLWIYFLCATMLFAGLAFGFLIPVKYILWEAIGAAISAFGVLIAINWLEWKK